MKVIFHWLPFVSLVAGVWFGGLAQAQVSANEPYGICAHLPGSEYSTRDTQLTAMDLANIDMVRFDIRWRDIQVGENPAQWHWQVIDTVINDAKNKGINVLGILGQAPDDFKPIYGSSTNLAAWETYVGAVVDRYKADVKYWEVGNELNHPNSADYMDAEDYAVVLERAYNRIKAVDPDAKVVFQGLANDSAVSPYGIPFNYIDDVFDAGGADHYDIMNIHPYRVTGGIPPEQNLAKGRLQKEIENLRTFLDNYVQTQKGKPIWVTEFGYPTVNNYNGYTITEAQQAKWTSRAMMIFLHAGVERVFIYEQVDYPGADNYVERHFGLRTDASTGKIGWNAYKQLAKSMRPPGSVAYNTHDWYDLGSTSTVDDDVYYPCWIRPDGRMGWAVWKPFGSTPLSYTFNPGGTIYQCQDVAGTSVSYTYNPGTGNVTVSLTDNPIFIVAGTAGQYPNAVSYYRIKNYWTNEYMRASYSTSYDAAVAFTNVSSSDTYGRWTLEAIDGYRRFRNQATGKYLSVEDLKGYVQVRAHSSPGAWSSQWNLVQTGTNRYRFYNRWSGGGSSNPYEMHLQNQNDFVEYYPLTGYSDPWSDQWILEEVP